MKLDLKSKKIYRLSEMKKEIYDNLETKLIIYLRKILNLKQKIELTDNFLEFNNNNNTIKINFNLINYYYDLYNLKHKNVKNLNLIIFLDNVDSDEYDMLQEIIKLNGEYQKILIKIKDN